MSGLWRNDPLTREGKYLVTRRDGTVPEWPHFVLGAKDPCAPEALMAYAAACETLRMDPEYVADVRALAEQFREYQETHGFGDPDGPPHRKDDPATIARMAPRYHLIVAQMNYDEPELDHAVFDNLDELYARMVEINLHASDALVVFQGTQVTLDAAQLLRLREVKDARLREEGRRANEEYERATYERLRSKFEGS